MAKIKVWLNMGVNALSFVAFLSLISTGMILHFTLPPGSGSGGMGMRYGAGRIARRFLGMTRHDWGDIHFAIAVIFFGLLMAHLFLHWNWLYCTAWGTKANPQPFWRRVVTFVILTYIALAFGLPFIK